MNRLLGAYSEIKIILNGISVTINNDLSYKMQNTPSVISHAVLFIIDQFKLSIYSSWIKSLGNNDQPARNKHQVQVQWNILNPPDFFASQQGEHQSIKHP